MKAKLEKCQSVGGLYYVYVGGEYVGYVSKSHKSGGWRAVLQNGTMRHGMTRKEVLEKMLKLHSEERSA